MSERFKALCSSVAALLVLLPAALGAQSAQPSASPDSLARQMIELTGGQNLAKQVMQQMVTMFRGQNPTVPQEFWDELLASADTDQLVDLTVPIYVEHLSVEEMQAAIDFYSTPAGKSLVQKMPIIVQQSMSAGQRWGQGLARQVQERLEKYKAAHPNG